MGLMDKIFGKKAEAPPPPPKGVEGAKSAISGRKSKLDQLEDEAVNGTKYRNGGLVKQTPKSTPYKCK